MEWVRVGGGSWGALFSLEPNPSAEVHAYLSHRPLSLGEPEAQRTEATAAPTQPASGPGPWAWSGGSQGEAVGLCGTGLPFTFAALPWGLVN